MYELADFTPSYYSQSTVDVREQGAAPLAVVDTVMEAKYRDNLQAAVNTNTHTHTHTHTHTICYTLSVAILVV